MAQKQHRMSMKCLRPFFYLPARPTKPDQRWKFSTTAFFIQFGQNLMWGLIMNQKQHRISLKCLQQLSDLPAWPIQIDHRLQPLFSPLANSPHIPSRTIILFRFSRYCYRRSWIELKTNKKEKPTTNKNNEQQQKRITTSTTTTSTTAKKQRTTATIKNDHEWQVNNNK